MKMNKKGFTIVELVIVIAVIAILAGVMIPTFGNVIESANESSAQQQAKNVHTSLVAEEATLINTTVYIEVAKGNGYVYKVENGAFTATTAPAITVPEDAPEGTNPEWKKVDGGKFGGYTIPTGVTIYVPYSYTVPTK